MSQVTEDNFVIAESDRYFSEHVAQHPVNTIRHSRAVSGPDNQFVITENRDVLYSHAVVDASRGAVVTNPAWDTFSAIQVIDEREYTIAVLYPGDRLKVTPSMLSLGGHVFLNMRTGLPSLDAAGLAAAHAHQDGFGIEAGSAAPYVSKGFDKASLDRVRAALVLRMGEVDRPWLAFGSAGYVDPTTYLIAAAGGWGGLPAEHASYISSILPGEAERAGAPAAMTLPPPPLQFDKGGFLSVTTYNSDSWIATDNFALSNRQAVANPDGGYTFRYNCPGQPNNIDVVPGWRQIIRLYLPKGLDEILAYTRQVNETVRVVPA